VWRITGAKSIPEDAISAIALTYRFKILRLIGRLLAVEDPVQEVFEILEEGNKALAKSEDSDVPLVEVVILARLMNTLGFLARPVEFSVLEELLNSSHISEHMLRSVAGHRKALVQKINSALEEAK
jgi:hypothetical protein